MPTSYTEKIKDGMSFRDFVMRCAKGFGALIEMREDSLDVEVPEKFKYSSYHLEKLRKREKRLKQLESMSLEEAYKKSKEEYRGEIERETLYVEETNRLRKLYNDMLFKVKAWRVPSKDHRRLKEFMIEQIEDSIKWDCHKSKINNIRELSGEEWLDRNIKNTVNDIKYHKEEYLKEIIKVDKRNLWIMQLRESL